MSVKAKYALLVLVAACGETTPTAPTQLHLNRPTDMAFACYGGLRVTGGSAATTDQDIELSAQPMEGCDDRAHTTAVTPIGQEDLTSAGGAVLPAVNYYGFILEPNISTVALAAWPAKPPTSFTGADINLLDADPLTPGVNGITVGDNPVGITADTIGCKIVTANQGSCDMSVLDVNSAVDLPAQVERLVVKNAAGAEIRAKPFAMVGEPPAGTIGNLCPATATGMAYVAYPNCHMVAIVDLATGVLVDSISFDASGTAAVTGASVTCADECGGGATVAGIRPTALDMSYDVRTGRRLLAIGADNSDLFTMVELGTSGLTLDRPQNIFQIPLEDPSGKLGITAVSISPQIGMGGDGGVINDTSAPGGQFQFVYGVATDRSVRVADVLSVRKECDAEVDPRFIQMYTMADINKLSCFPVGDPATPPRRPGARTPGIELIGDQVPTSVATYHVDSYDGDTRGFGPFTMIGYFGAISSENGAIYMFNIDDDSQADFVHSDDVLGTQIPLDIAHQLRDSLPNRGLLAVSTDGTNTPVCDSPGPDPDNSANNGGGARTPAAPVRNVPGLYVSGPKVGELPYIRQLLCSATDDTRAVSELEFAAPVDLRSLEFPDLRGLRGDEEWTLTYQGTLSLDPLTPPAIDGPIARTGNLNVDNASAMRLDDPTRPFCDAGVEPYDIVSLLGCDPASPSDCPVGYTCYVHPQSQVANLGSCMLSDEADRLASACKPFLTSLRRYTVQKSASGELTLMPRKHILRTTPIDGCTSDNQCVQLANYAVQNASTANPIDTTIVDTHHWQCAVDAALAPETDPTGQPLKRCIETCTMDSDCSIGTTCDNGFCMEGVIPPQACVNAPQKFELRASEAFVVIGAKTGYVHPIIADASGNCVRDPNANPLQIGRVPLKAPACDPTADPRTGVNPSGVHEPNPCQTTVMHTEEVASYVPGTCTANSPATTLVTRDATAIKFRDRGMTLTMVDPTYPGDGMCIGDRQGNLGNVPLTADGYQIGFRQVGGFQGLFLNIVPSLPVKIVRQPRGVTIDPSRDLGFGDPIWVVDEGDFISTSITAASTLGKVFRVESQALTIINTLE
jgi:hypothetical protein